MYNPPLNPTRARMGPQTPLMFQMILFNPKRGEKYKCSKGLPGNYTFQLQFCIALTDADAVQEDMSLRPPKDRYQRSGPETRPRGPHRPVFFVVVSIMPVVTREIHQTEQNHHHNCNEDAQHDGRLAVVDGDERQNLLPARPMP